MLRRILVSLVAVVLVVTLYSSFVMRITPSEVCYLCNGLSSLNYPLRMLGINSNISATFISTGAHASIANRCFELLIALSAIGLIAIAVTYKRSRLNCVDNKATLVTSH